MTAGSPEAQGYEQAREQAELNAGQVVNGTPQLVQTVELRGVKFRIKAGLSAAIVPRMMAKADNLQKGTIATLALAYELVRAILYSNPSAEIDEPERMWNLVEESTTNPDIEEIKLDEVMEMINNAVEVSQGGPAKPS